MSYLLQQGFFVLRTRYIFIVSGYLRRLWFLLLGMKAGKGVLFPSIYITWPHQVSFNDNCIIEHGSYFKYSGVWKKGPSICFGKHVFIGSFCEFNISSRISVGDETNIASGCRFIDHDHGIKREQLISKQKCVESSITIGEGVWLGFNVTVLKGVNIGNGAVIAAGAVVTKSVPELEIWAGIPAKKIGERK